LYFKSADKEIGIKLAESTNLKHCWAA